MSGEAVVTLARKSYDHLLRTRDRALNDAKWQREQVEHAHRWAQEAFAEQRRLADRLDRVVAAAAALGVSIQDINAALAPTAAEQVHAARAVADRDAARIAGQVRASGEGP